MKTNLADLRDFAQGYVGQLHSQIDDQLPHIWREASRRFLWLFAWPGSKQTDHSLIIKVICLALQASAWLTCFFGPLNGRIAEKYDRA